MKLPWPTFCTSCSRKPIRFFRKLSARNFPSGAPVSTVSFQFCIESPRRRRRRGGGCIGIFHPSAHVSHAQNHVSISLELSRFRFPRFRRSLAEISLCNFPSMREFFRIFPFGWIFRFPIFEGILENYGTENFSLFRIRSFFISTCVFAIFPVLGKYIRIRIVSKDVLFVNWTRL